MRESYPVIFTKTKDGIVVYVPDFDIYTEGADITEAIKMARDAIGLMGIDMEDDGETIPAASDIGTIILTKKNDLLTLVDVDFAEYRRKADMKTVKKNCTIPSWLCYEAEEAHINFSQVLQNALKEQLHLS